MTQLSKYVPECLESIVLDSRAERENGLAVGMTPPHARAFHSHEVSRCWDEIVRRDSLIPCAQDDGSDPQTVPGTPPDTPTGVTVYGGTSEVTLSWNAAVGAGFYFVYWDTAPGVTPATGTSVLDSASPFVHTALSNGTTYYYVVTAANGAGEGPPSAEVSAQAHGCDYERVLAQSPLCLGSCGYNQRIQPTGHAAGLRAIRLSRRVPSDAKRSAARCDRPVSYTPKALNNIAQGKRT